MSFLYKFIIPVQVYHSCTSLSFLVVENKIMENLSVDFVFVYFYVSMYPVYYLLVCH